MSEMKEYFDSNGYIYLKSILDRETCDFMVDQVFKTYDQEETHLYDEQSPKSESFYDLPIFKILHEQLKSTFEQATGLSLIPTNTYARIYRKGDRLPIHQDREECEISASITLGLSDEKNWPISFSKDSDQSAPVTMEIDVGSAVVFKGSELWHWRDELQEDWQVQVFLHYVNAEGKYVNRKVTETDDEDDKWVFGLELKEKLLYITFDNFLSDTLIDKIVEYSDGKTETAKIGTEEKSGVNKKIRNAKTTDLPIKDFTWLYLLLEDAIMRTNHHNYKFGLEYMETLTYIEYYGTDEGHYDWHVDGMINSSRKLSFSILLSDPNDYEGGQLILNDGLEWKVEKKKGQVVFFPANVLHKVEPVTSGVRRVIVGWIHGPHFG